MQEDNCAIIGWCNNPYHDHGEGKGRLSTLIDSQDPAFDYIVEVLTDMIGSGVEPSPEMVAAAVKMGRLKHQREELPRKIMPARRRGAPQGPVVYYIRRGNLIKIGTTKRLRDRMNVLMPDEVLAVEPGDECMERERHKQFAALRIDARGEYFFPGLALQEHISRIRAEHGAPPAGLPTLKAASRAWAQDLDEDDVEFY